MTEQPGSTGSLPRASASRSLARDSARRSRQRWSNANKRWSTWVTSTVSATAAIRAPRDLIRGPGGGRHRTNRQSARRRTRMHGGPSPRQGEHVSGQLVGSAQLSSGRFAMIETLSGDGGLGFSIVPGSPSWTAASGSTSPAACALAATSNRSFGRKRGLGCKLDEQGLACWAREADQRHPFKAGAFRAPASLLAALTGCRRPGEACQAGTTCWEQALPSRRAGRSMILRRGVAGAPLA